MTTGDKQLHVAVVAARGELEFKTKKSLHCANSTTLWFQLEDMFQLIGTPQGIEHVMVQLRDMPQGFKKYTVEYKAWMKFLVDKSADAREARFFGEYNEFIKQ